MGDRSISLWNPATLTRVLVLSFLIKSKSTYLSCVVLGTCTIEDKKELAGLQGADAVSYAGYQQEKGGDESELMDFAPDWNLDNARNVLRAGSPVFRSYARPEILKELKENLFVLEKKRQQFGQRKAG
jgi:hypothetical protein